MRWEARINNKKSVGSTNLKGLRALFFFPGVALGARDRRRTLAIRGNVEYLPLSLANLRKQNPQPRHPLHAAPNRYNYRVIRFFVAEISEA